MSGSCETGCQFLDGELRCITCGRPSKACPEGSVMPPWPPCAVCGKPGGGTCSNTKWGHHAYCCSDECGLAYKGSDQEARENLRRAQLRAARLRAELKAAEHEVFLAEGALEAREIWS